MATLDSEIEFLKKIGDNALGDILMQQSDGTYAYGPDPSELNEKILFFKSISIKLDKYVYGLIGLFITDINMLRRFLDKSYITNVVAYTHAYNAIDCARLLVKYFGFKITNWSYLKNNDLKMCETMINESKSYTKLQVLFLKPLLVQCTDLGSFPKSF